jgi:hypothetical protein
MEQQHCRAAQAAAKIELGWAGRVFTNKFAKIN